MVFRALSMVHPSEDEVPWGWNPVPDEVGGRDLLGVEVQRIADQLVALIEEVVHPHGDSPALLRELVPAQHDGATGDDWQRALAAHRPILSEDCCFGNRKREARVPMDSALRPGLDCPEAKSAHADDGRGLLYSSDVWLFFLTRKVGRLNVAQLI